MANDSDWVENATANNNPGAPGRVVTHTPAGKDISEKRLHAAAHSKNNTIRREADLAETLRKFHPSKGESH
jgi:hypothetical protein